MSWELGPLVEKTAQYELRVARRHGVAANHYTGEPRLLADAARLRDARPPWVPVLDSGDGWLVTELDLSVGLEAVGEVLLGDEAGPAEPIAPEVIAAASQVMAAAVHAGRDPRSIRFDWRGRIRLSPLASAGGELADAILRLAPTGLQPRPGQAWDDARVAVFVMRWLEENLPDLFVAHQRAEAWLELPGPAHVEAAILQEPDDEARWRVLADALLEQGHPRGTLIALQLARADETATRNHLRKHPWLLPVGGSSMRLVLERGFVTRLDYGSTAFAHLPALRLMLSHPALRFLRTLFCPLRIREAADFITALEESHHRAVREVQLPSVKNTEATFARLQRSLPRLLRVVSRP